MSTNLRPIRASSHRERRAKRLARARRLGTHTALEWELLKALCRQACVACGATDRHIEKDHIVPLYLGGCDCIANLQPVCAWCNCRKSGECTDHRLPIFAAIAEANG